MRTRGEIADARKRTESRDWFEDEPRVSGVASDFVRLCQRARRRPLAVACATAVAAVLVAAELKVEHRAFEPRLVLRVTEADRDSSIDARPKQQLRDYVSRVAFSDGRLLSLIERLRLYPAAARKNPRDALNAFRRNIQVDVYRNYFLNGIEDGGPRSARIALAYRSTDPELALTVTHALGLLVETQEVDSEREEASLASLQADRALSRASEQMLRQERAITEKTVALARGAAASSRLRVEVADLQASVSRAEPRLLEIARRKAVLDLDSAREQSRAAVHFDVVDSGAIPQSRLPSAAKLWLRGAVELLLAMPLVGLLVGAFDPCVRGSDDVHALGLTTLGRVRLTHRGREEKP
jgi:hypothetical protein